MHWAQLLLVISLSGALRMNSDGRPKNLVPINSRQVHNQRNYEILDHLMNPNAERRSSSARPSTSGRSTSRPQDFNHLNQHHVAHHKTPTSEHRSNSVRSSRSEKLKALTGKPSHKTDGYDGLLPEVPGAHTGSDAEEEEESPEALYARKQAKKAAKIEEKILREIIRAGYANDEEEARIELEEQRAKRARHEAKPARLERRVHHVNQLDANPEDWRDEEYVQKQEPGATRPTDTAHWAALAARHHEDKKDEDGSDGEPAEPAGPYAHAPQKPMAPRPTFRRGGRAHGIQQVRRAYADEAANTYDDPGAQ